MRRATEDATAARLIRDRSPVRVLEASVSAGVAAVVAVAAGRVIYADSAYASRLNLCLCKECGIMPFISMKKNATTAGRGHGAVWGMSVREQHGRGARNVSDLTAAERADGLEEWRENSGYGKRWMVEIILSDFKRLFGSGVRALKWENRPGDQTRGVGLQHADQCGMGDTGRGRTGGSCTAPGRATAAIRRFLCHTCLLIT